MWQIILNITMKHPVTWTETGLLKTSARQVTFVLYCYLKMVLSLTTFLHIKAFFLKKNRTLALVCGVKRKEGVSGKWAVASQVLRRLRWTWGTAENHLVGGVKGIMGAETEDLRRREWLLHIIFIANRFVGWLSFLIVLCCFSVLEGFHLAYHHATFGSLLSIFCN